MLTEALLNYMLNLVPSPYSSSVLVSAKKIGLLTLHNLATLNQSTNEDSSLPAIAIKQAGMGTAAAAASKRGRERDWIMACASCC